MANRNKPKTTYKKKKSLGLRIFIIAIAAAMAIGIFIMPLTARAEGNTENLTIASFETGKIYEYFIYFGLGSFL